VLGQLATRTPALFLAEYQRAAGALRRAYEQRGLPLESMMLDLPSIGMSGEQDGPQQVPRGQPTRETDNANNPPAE